MNSKSVCMKYIIPPACEPTVPLLGPYQIEGYAKKIGYDMEIYDFNNLFFHEIINNKCYQISITGSTNIDILEIKAYEKFINSFDCINSFSDLQNKLSSCTNTKEYWKLIDYVRCCYDIYSFNYNQLRFRIDGIDSRYRWNIWSDLNEFIEEFSDSHLCQLMKLWVENMDIQKGNIIGINITFESQLYFALLLCKMLGEFYPDNKIVVGGGFVNSFINSGDSIGPLSKYCDIVNSGEGEALIWYLKNNNNDISGIVKNGEKSDNRAFYISAADICNIKLSVCPPDISRKDLENYFSPAKVLPLRFTYQCYWGKCKFCTDKEYHACLDSKYNVSEMIEYCVSEAQKGTYDCIYFLDSAIPFPVLREFCNQVIAQKIKIKWGTNSRFDPPFADEEFIQLLSRAGCVFIKFGLESGSQKVLNLMDKGTKIENAKQIIKHCRKHNILVHTYIMFAFPGETDEDRFETMEFILDDESHPDNYNCSEFIMYGNSLIAKELNYQIENDENDEEGWHSASYSFSNDNIKKQISDLRRRFDEKYSPADILISTGHTIALANVLKKSDTKIKLTRKSLLKVNNSVVFDSNNKIVARWRRRDGLVYISNEESSILFEARKEPHTVEQMLEIGINTNTLFDLINEGFLDVSDFVNDEQLAYEGESQIHFTYGNRFNSLKWYGYYDNN